MLERDKILYIDDEEANLVLFQEIFSTHYDLHTARSTKEAEGMMERLAFKVIISDIKMPNESGLQFFNRLPQSDTSPILIILTAFKNDHLLLEALNQGRIFRYLNKPLEREVVRTTIDQAIQLYDLHFENHKLYVQILENQKNFYNIFQSSQDGIVIIDENEVILEANKAFKNRLKSNTINLTGKKLVELLPESIYENIAKKHGELLENPFSCIEFEYYSQSEGKIVVELNCSPIDYRGTRSFLVIFRDITERKNDELKLLNAIIQAEEKERSRLAKDLHDGLGPIMSSLKMYLEWLNKQDNMSDHPDILDLSLDSINEAIVTLKRISNNLSPHILEKFGLVSALNKYIENIGRVSPIRFNVSVNVDKRHGLTKEMSLYRIITECITNSVSHGRASLIDINLYQDERFLYFTFKDNGIGFSLQDVENQETGSGLHNINNRIKTLGGKMDIKTSPGTGFLLKTEIPII
jgi:PAS domain S-box-containing protein